MMRLILSSAGPMMTSSKGSIFRVSGHLCGEWTGPRWIPLKKSSDAELWCFLWFAGDLRRYRAHYDVTLMPSCKITTPYFYRRVYSLPHNGGFALLLWFDADGNYPHLSGLIHNYWENHAIAPTVPVISPWRIQVNTQWEYKMLVAHNLYPRHGNALQWRHNECDGVSNHSIVCTTICSGSDQKIHQSSASLAFVRGIHRWPVNSPHKGPVTRNMFPFDDVIMVLFDGIYSISFEDMCTRSRCQGRGNWLLPTLSVGCN